MTFDLHLVYQFQWWHVPLRFFLLFVTTYIFTATKLIARNDFKDGGKKK